MDTQGLIQRLQEGTARLRDVAECTTEVLSRTYGGGKWNGVQIYAHLADACAVFYYRFLRAAAEEGSEIVPFDQDVWIAELRGALRPIPLSLQVIESSLAGMIHFLGTLPAKNLQRAAHHPQRGPLTPVAIAEMVAWHNAHHLDQLDAIRDGRSWTAESR